MKIEKSNYEGYLWYSDQDKPQVLRGEDFELEIADNANPFIIEGQLYDEKNNKSIRIKYVDGRYYPEKPINLLDFNSKEVDELEYLPHRMNEDDKGQRIVKLNFLRYWEEKEDEFCENMKVLQPSELVFVGFNYSEEEK